MILLFILALLLYYKGEKISSLLLFIGFVTDAYQLIPFSLIELGLGLKSYDYGLAYAFCVLLLNQVLVKHTPHYGLNRVVQLFLVYLIGSMLYSHYMLSIGWADIIRSSRIYFLFLTPFLFADLSIAQYLRLRHRLLQITLFVSVLFILQSLFQVQILNGYIGGEIISLGIMDVMRCYNLPYFGVYFFFYVMLNKEIQGRSKVIQLIVLGLPIFLSFHRSLLAAVAFTIIFLLYVTQESFLKRFKHVMLSIMIAAPVCVIAAGFFSERGGGQDIINVINGNFQEVDYVEELTGQTFLFRMAHLYERTMYIMEQPITTLFGAGWVHEDSSYTINKFDFMIGLRDDATGDIAQVDTSDISWSPLVFRVGFVGTALYVFFTLYIFIIAYKRRYQLPGATVVGTMLVMAITSVTGIMYIVPAYFILLLVDSVFMLRIEQDGAISEEQRAQIRVQQFSQVNY